MSNGKQAKVRKEAEGFSGMPAKNRAGTMNANEADTCRTYVLPKLKSSDCEDEYITEQMVLTPGRIVAYLDSVQARLASLR